MDNDRTRNIYKYVMIILITAIVTMLISTVVAYNYNKNNSQTKYVIVGAEGNTGNIQQAVDSMKKIVEDNFLWDVPEDKDMVDEVLKGYVKGLKDEYSEYMTAAEWENYQTSSMGNYIGIGILSETRDEGLYIVSVYEGSPAEKADLQAGDILTKVGDIVCNKENANSALEFMKSDTAGTKFDIEYVRGEERGKKTITREMIRLIQAEAKMLDNNIGYIELYTFDTGSAEDIRNKCKNLISEGAKGIILDLRNNYGGVMQQATEIADMFLDKDKVIMITRNKKDEQEVLKAKTSSEFTVPLVVLSNKHSASASEILIAALKDNNRAQVVGTNSFGKGVMQIVLKLSNGARLKITSEEFLRPNGAKIHGVGIEPNLEVNLPEEYSKTLIAPEEDDTQLQKAIELLK